MTSIFGNLRKRRVFQIVGIYLGAVFGLLEFTDMIVGRYSLSDNLVDMVLLGMLSLLPTIIMLAYFHGAPGKDQWNRVEQIGIPTNVVASLALLVALFQGEEVGAVSEIREVTDEHGTTMVREVAKASFVQPLGIYFFDPVGLPEDDEWLSYAVPDMLSASLDRDSFLYSRTPYEGYGNGVFWQIRRAGYDRGLGLPLSLQQRLAVDRHRRFFIRGQIGRSQQNYQLTLKLYETATLTLIAETVISGSDPFQLVEEAVPFVKDKLEVQSPKNALSVQNMPISELLSPSIDALKTYIAGKNALLFDNDYTTAIESWEKAIEIDPDFAAPYLVLANAYSQTGDMTAALNAVRQALRLGDKLPEEVEIAAKAALYELRQEMDMARGVYEMWVQLYPDSAMAINQLARHYQWNGGETDQPLALEAYQRSLQLDPNQDHIVMQLANLNLMLGNTAEAIGHYQDYHHRRPNDYAPLVTLGDIKLHRGDFDGARLDYEKGSHAQSDMVTPVLRMAEVAIRTGDFRNADNRLDDAGFIAQAPRQYATILRERIRIYRLTGRPRDAFDLLDDNLEMRSQFDQPINVLMTAIVPYMDLYVEVGEVELALEMLDEERQRYDAPWDALVGVGYLVLYLAQEKPELAAPHIEAIEEMLAQGGEASFMYQVRFSQGIMQHQLGNLDAALERFEQAEALLSGSLVGFQQDDDRISLLAERCETQLKAGDAEAARETAVELLHSWPHHPRGNVLLARANLELGDQTSAREALERALQVWANAETDFEPARLARKLLEGLDG